MNAFNQNRLIHPLQRPKPFLHAVSPLKFVRNQKGLPSEAFEKARGMGWSISSVIHSVVGFVEDIISIAGAVFNAFVKLVTNVFSTIANIIGNILDAIGFTKLMLSIASGVKSIVKSIANVLVKYSPDQFVVGVLERSQFSKHTFKELNKYTGGIFTTAANVSTLVARAAAGDTITKQELLRDAIFVLQVAAICFGAAPLAVALGGIVGADLGNYACQGVSQGKNSQAVCKSAFTVVGVAAGTYYDGLPTATDQALVNEFNTSSENNLEDTQLNAEAEASGITDQAATSEASEAAAETTQVTLANPQFTQVLSTSGQNYFTTQTINLATQTAIKACQKGQWVSQGACLILGQIANTYLQSGGNVDWPTFLAEELLKLGILSLAKSWFPVGSPEYNAIVGVSPASSTVVTASPTQASFNPVWILAGAAAIAVMIGAS